MSSFSLQDKTRVYLLNGDGTCSAPHQRWGLWLSPNETMRKHWETIRLTIQNISYMLCYIASLSLYIYDMYIYIYTSYISYQLYQLYISYIGSPIPVKSPRSRTSKLAVPIRARRRGGIVFSVS